MKLTSTKEFVAWLNNQQPGSAERLYADAALRFLRTLPAAPVDDLAPTLIRVRRAQRHVLWRISHPYDPGVAVRILCWFPDAETVVALVGGEKAALGDLWYDSAAPRAESAVDQWLRLHPPRDSGG